MEAGNAGRTHPFHASPDELNELTVPGREALNLAALESMGGGPGICSRLITDPTNGIAGSAGDIISRHHAFGENRFPDPPFDSVFRIGRVLIAYFGNTSVSFCAGWTSLFLGCFNELILIVLLVAAGVSLIVNTINRPSDVRTV